MYIYIYIYVCIYIYIYICILIYIYIYIYDRAPRLVPVSGCFPKNSCKMSCMGVGTPSTNIGIHIDRVIYTGSCMVFDDFFGFVH